MIHTLNDYIARLEESGLLAAAIPEALDRSAPVALVSYDSREVIPGTLFLCKGAHFRAEFLDMARDKGAVAYVSELPYPASGLPCIFSDSITRELAITDRAHYLGLDRSPAEWAELAAALAAETPRNREEYAGRVREGGFEIEDVAAWLQEFYLSL